MADKPTRQKSVQTSERLAAPSPAAPVTGPVQLREAHPTRIRLASDQDVTVTLSPNTTAPQRRSTGETSLRRRPYPNAPAWAITPGDEWPAPDPRHRGAEGLPPRYMFGREIGRGGQGRILTVFDTDLGRPVATKTILAGPNASDETVRRFIHEVQITGQLEHPNIIPVHELGRLANGEIFYTMKLIEGRTLADIIHRLALKDPQVHQEFGPVRLVTILQQICQGVAFAHDRGVVHRDLKPSNIMLGEFGEVTVMDWGCAKVRQSGERDTSTPRRPVITERSGSGDWTVVGTVQGTPAYMSPEQAAGQSDQIDERTDIYALGAILYEILTHHPPVEGHDVAAKLEAVRNSSVIPPRQRAPELEIPEELEEICMRCLARRPEDRYASALELHAALEAYLEGTLALERRGREATAIARSGHELVAQYEKVVRRIGRLRERIRMLEARIERWEPVERKRPLWRSYQQLEQLQVQRISVLGGAVKVFNQALSHDPQNRDARSNLARLYWFQFQDAEQRRDRSDMLYFEALVREFDDGQYTDALRGDGMLSISSNPGGARVRLYRYREIGQRLRPTGVQELGRTPIRGLKVPLGSYLLVLSHPGHQETRAPVFIGRQESVELEVRLPSAKPPAPGYVPVPAGPFIAGGDARASEAPERQQQWVDGFAIGRYPVTCAEYLEFLNAISRIDAAEAQRRCPRYGGFQGYYWSKGEDQVYKFPSTDPSGNAWDARWPVFGVSWEDAEAYCRWRSGLEGYEVRLPTGWEWEKAARGVDGRYFPWGDTFDPSFCKMRESREMTANPEPVGTFEADESPFGVRDMAGGITEWCRDWFNEKQGLRLVKGGAWSSTQDQCRLARRHGEHARDTFNWVGFRVVRPLEPRPTPE